VHEQPGVANKVVWIGHVALHFLTETRWTRTMHLVR
jgi:signal peptidase I